MDSPDFDQHTPRVVGLPAHRYYELALRTAQEILLPKALSGERWAALRLCQLYGDALDEGVAIPGEVAQWIGGLLRKLADGETFEAASGVPSRRRGEKIEVLARANSAQTFSMALKFGVLHYAAKQKRIVAARMVAETFGRSSETVLTAWKKHKAECLRMIKLEEETFGRDHLIRLFG